MTSNNIATGLLFTSKTCPNCPPAKKEFEKLKETRKDIELHSLMTNTPQGQRLAKKFKIMSVPTFIFYGPGHETPMGLVGSQSLETLNKYVDKAIGITTNKEKTKFSLKKLFKKKD